MQIQSRPKLYADINKHMDQSYYNYEDYEIEYGQSFAHAETSSTTRLSTRSARANTLKSTLA